MGRYFVRHERGHIAGASVASNPYKYNIIILYIIVTLIIKCDLEIAVMGVGARRMEFCSQNM